MRALRLGALLAALALGALAATALAAEAKPRASATALAVLVRSPGQPVVAVGEISAPPRASFSQGEYLYPADGSIVSARGLSTSAATGPGAGARAQASSSLAGVSLLGGALELANVVTRAEASVGDGGPQGSLDGSTIGSVLVAGAAVEPVPNRQVALGDWGYAVLLEQAVQYDNTNGRGYRGFVTAAHVHLTAGHMGLPAGSEILIGYAEAAGQAPLPPPPAKTSTAAEPDGGAEVVRPPKEPVRQPPGAAPNPPAIVRNPPASVQPDITGEGYVFPVYGPASFSNDFGAPRANTGWHHGNDIFAPLGAPVLAVADGTLFLVGWNPIGGHRLWLRDASGNEYYYAHLSAYTPQAVNGARVRAGDVIGFVGASGDAQGTPFHLHFEIHPAALLGLGYDGVINPYPYLVAWREREDVSFSAAAAPVASGLAPAPGAVVLEAQDISSARGLDPSALTEALGLPSLGEGVLALFPPPLPALVGAPPGFSSLG